MTEAMTPTKAAEDVLVERLRGDAICLRAWSEGKGPYPETVKGVSRKIAERADKAADAITTLLERERTLTEALKASDSCLQELQATVVGECPSLLDEDSGGSAHLDMAIDDALLKSAIALGKCASCRHPREWVPGQKCKEPSQHIPQPTWTEEARAALTREGE